MRNYFWVFLIMYFSEFDGTVRDYDYSKQDHYNYSKLPRKIAES